MPEPIIPQAPAPAPQPRTPLFDREVPDYVPATPAPVAPVPAPTAPVPGQPPVAPVPNPAAPVPAPAPVAPVPEPTFAEKLAAARVGATPEGPGTAQVIDKLDELGNKIVEGNQPPTMPGQQRDEQGNLVGDPNLPWHMAGSSNEPPSWQAITDHATAQAKEEIQQEAAAEAEAKQKKFDDDTALLKGQLQSLETSGVINSPEEKQAIIDTAKKYQQFDMFEAAKLWGDLGKPIAGQERNVQRTEQRRQTFGRVNNGGPSDPRRTPAPSYADIHNNTFSQISEKVVANLDSELTN